MKAGIWQKLKKTENIVLGILLYGIVLFYSYQFILLTNKYHIFNPDEYMYYMEAKAFSAHGLLEAPFSLDGNTSIIGNLGYHGISYALKDGLLAILFFQSSDPPLLLNNFLTLIATLAFILLFKPLNITTRLKIALVIITHHVLYSYTFSYMQETIHYFFAALALAFLYLIYQHPNNKKYLYYYFIVVIVATTFRYTWCLWGLGLLPLYSSFNNFRKWLLVMAGLSIFAIFIAKYIYAPYPYINIVINKIVNTENTSLGTAFNLILENFFNNLKLFFSVDEKIEFISMRYLLIFLLITNTIYAIIKRNKFVIGCSLIAWCYFFVTTAFYIVVTGHEARMMSVLNPLLAFSLFGYVSDTIFYPVIAVQLFILPIIVQKTEVRNQSMITMNERETLRAEKEASYSKIGDSITDDKPAVISLPTIFTYQFNPDYFLKFPLITQKGYPIHYRTYVTGNDLRNVHKINYLINPEPFEIPNNSQLVYSDKWTKLYKVTE